MTIPAPLVVYLAAALLTPGRMLVRPPQPCVPSHPVPTGQRAGDSVTIRGQRVPRTARAVRRAHLAEGIRLDGPAFYAGERVLIKTGGQAAGSAIWDGCTLVPESAAAARALGVGLDSLFVEPAVSEDYTVLRIVRRGGKRDVP